MPPQDSDKPPVYEEKVQKVDWNEVDFDKQMSFSHLILRNMVSTRHCCWGRCTSDSRYPEKLNKSLKEMQDLGQKIFILFPKPSQGIDRCQRQSNACSCDSFTVRISQEIRTSVPSTGQAEKDQQTSFRILLKANLPPHEV